MTTYAYPLSPARKRRLTPHTIYIREKVYNFIIEFKTENDGCSPSIREICEHCEISSTSVTNYYLVQMVKEGRLAFIQKGKSRNIMVIGGKWGMEPSIDVTLNLIKRSNKKALQNATV